MVFVDDLFVVKHLVVRLFEVLLTVLVEVGSPLTDGLSPKTRAALASLELFE